MFDPVNYCVVIHSCTAFNGSKSHAIDIKLQAVMSDFFAVASAAVGFHKLATALLADVALLAILVTVL